MEIDDLTSDQEETPKSQRFYHSLPKSYKEDIVDDTYQIHTDRPVNELGDQFSRYYFATHMESEKEYFAIILENNFRAPIHELSVLKNSHCPTINNLLAYSLVKLGVSKKYSLVAIVEKYRPEDNLQSYIEKNGRMNSEQIEKQIIPSISAAFSYLESNRMNCSNLCPSNILIDKDGNVKLREFFISLPNFNQQTAFLSPEIADAMPYGRKVFGISSDIYALGVSMFFALTGEVPSFSPHEPKLYNAYRLETGTYEGAIAKRRIPKRIKTFLAWTLKDDPNDRWSAPELMEWQAEKKEFSLPKPKSTANYTTLFSGHNYSNPRALASAMFTLYDEGTKFCKDDLFLKWVQKTKGKTEFVEDFVHMQAQHQTVRGMTQGELEDSFFKILKQLDHTSQYIRLRDFCITIASVPNIMFETICRESTSWSEKIEDIFEHEYYYLLENKYNYAQIPIEYSDKLLNIAEKYNATQNKDTALHELIYHTDKYIPCLSNVVISDYVLSLEDLLVALDKVASNTPNKLHIDSDIIAFIKSRIRLSDNDKSNISSLEKLVSSSKLLKGTSYLASAQENAPEIKIPHLASVVAQKLIEWINENIYNAKLKNVITSELAELAGSGILSQMLYVVSNPKLFHNDKKGHKAAMSEMKQMEAKINRLSDPNETYLEGVALGQRVTVLLSYLLCMIVALILVLG